MSDSVDRVFVHALATVRRLPRTGSSRPPPEARLRLYGLYKQSMEGDVSAILPRPSLPPSSPNPNDPPSNSVHRYASRDLRTRETQAEIEKWDAWDACKGLSRTEAKRRYITTLIETMKEYASGTAEARELVSELEFVWNQIRSQSGSDESEEGESPTRKLERAGLKDTASGSRTGRVRSIDPPGPGRGLDNNGGGSLFGRLSSSSSIRPQQSSTQSNGGLRVLSPISQRSPVDDIVENEELPEPIPDSEDEAQDEEKKQDHYETTPSSPVHPQAMSPTTDPWKSQMEAHLQRLTLELTALREQLSSHFLLSRSSFSFSNTLPADYHAMPFRKRLYWQTKQLISKLIRYFWLALKMALKQVAIQAALLAVVIVYGRIRKDIRVENWLRERLKEAYFWTQTELPFRLNRLIS